MKGNIFDSLSLSSVLDEIAQFGCLAHIKEISMGKTKNEDSHARIKIRSESRQKLDSLIKSLQKYDAYPASVYSKTFEVQGHIIDSLILSKILDIIYGSKARFELMDIKIGIEKNDFSYVKIKVITADKQLLKNITDKIVQQGAVLID